MKYNLQMVEALDAFKKPKQYWLNRIPPGTACSVYPPTAANMNRKRTDRRSDAMFSQVSFNFDRQLSGKVIVLCKGEDILLFSLLSAVFKTCLHLFTFEQEIVIGCPVFIRNRIHAGTKAGTESGVGFGDETDEEDIYNRYLLLLSRLEGEMSFRELLLNESQTVNEAIQHQYYPFENLIKPLKLDESRLYRTILLLENIHDPAMVEPLLPQNDLMIAFRREGENVEATVRYRTDVYTAESIRLLADRFGQVLAQALDHVDTKLKEFRFHEPETVRKRWETFNRTEQAYPKQATVHGLFEQQVQLTPEAPAVESGSQTVSYRELNERAERVAQLLRLCGAGRGRRVGIMAGHGPGLLAGILGVLKSGASYVPVDPDYPLERIRYMAEDSGLCAWVVEPGLEGSVPKEQVQGVVVVDDRGRAELLTDSGEAAVEAAAAVTAVEAEVAAAPETLIEGAAEVTTGAGKETAPEAPSEVTSEAGPEGTAEAEDEAYVIYTSGSTGRPKGVMVCHRNVVNYLWWARKMYLKGLDSVSMALYSSIAFDLTVTSLFLPLIAGGCVVAYRSEHRGQALMRVLEEDRVDVLKLTPTHLRLLAEEAVARPRRLKRLIVGGESLDSGLARRVSERFGHEVEIYNEYGPTEATVGCMIHRYAPEKDTEGSVPIGIPADNVQIYVLDPYGHPTPTGVIGEIYIGGEGVAVGYVGNPELTAERFVPNRHGGGRLYRTGDLGRRLPDGTLQYVGRRDEQVKVRGHRIELGEIELELQGHEAVKAAAVVARPDEGGELELWAYVQVNGTGLSEELKRYLSERLPEYMIPAYIEEREQLPVTSNGKIDRKALLEEEGSQRTPYVAPRNELEQRLVQLWEEVLGRDRIGIEDDFFKIGGHSLKAIMMLARVQREWSVNVPLAVLFDSPTVSGLASYVEDALNRRKEHSEPEEEQVESWQRIEPAEPREYYPAAAVQKRIYVLSQLAGAETAYNMPGAFVISGSLDFDRFREALHALIQRHESLRTSFLWIDGELMQRIHEKIEFEPEYSDILHGEDVEAELARIEASFIRAFDLSQAPLLRVKLVKTAEDRHVVLFDMHHIISDGVSQEILARELQLLYAGQKLKPLRIQYKDVVVWWERLRQTKVYKEHESFWLDQFGGGDIPVLEMPTDFPRPLRQSFDGGLVHLALDKDLIQGIHRLSRESGATVFMVLLAAWNVLLSKYAGTEDIVVGTTVAGRNHADMADIVGAFIQAIPLRNYPKAALTFSEFLQQVKKNTILAFDHQDYSFDQLIEKLELPRDVSRSPLFDTMFVLHNYHENHQERGQLQVGIKDNRIMDSGSMEEISNSGSTNSGSIHFIRRNDPELRKVKYDLTLVGTLFEEHLQLSLEYCSDLFRKETVLNMADHFLTLLRTVVAKPDIAISRIEIVTREEKRWLLYGLNQTDRPLQPKTIHRLIEERARRVPDRVAVICGGKSLTYRELNQRANQLARLLIASGVEVEDRVGLLVSRSLELIVGMLGILKAGAAYVPIDPEYPPVRIQFILEDSQVKKVVAERELAERVGCAQLCIDVNSPQLEKQSKRRPSVNVTASHLAYLIYTSGSTGKPKGVMIEHGAVHHFIDGLSREIRFKGTMLSITSMSFDIFVLESLLALVKGMQIVLADDEELKQRRKLQQLIAEHPVDIVQFTPARLQLLLADEEAKALLGSIQTLIVGGEVFEDALLKRVTAVTNADIYHVYGPTESTVWSTVQKVKASDRIHLGQPISNTRVYVLDPFLNPVPPGVIGEIYIGGKSLARGYWNRPELTEERFVIEPSRGERLYKTGDLGRRSRDGKLHYIGRSDHQIQMRGYRIEPTEIEAYMMTHEAIQNAAVKPFTNANGVIALCAYVVANQVLSAADIRLFLSQGLPEYMRPTYFVQLEQMPLTPSGKIDRLALPDPNESMKLSRDYVAPRTPLEQELADIWAEVLGIPRIGVTDHFFEVGGTSVQAVMLEVELENRGMPFKELIVYQYSTVETMAAYMENIRQNKEEGQLEDEGKPEIIS